MPESCSRACNGREQPRQLREGACNAREAAKQALWPSTDALGAFFAAGTVRALFWLAFLSFASAIFWQGLTFVLSFNKRYTWLLEAKRARAQDFKDVGGVNALTSSVRRKSSMHAKTCILKEANNKTMKQKEQRCKHNDPCNIYTCGKSKLHTHMH